ncbi:MAG: acyl-CoA dehydrogenase family protein [Gemmatimonadota bacterium]
MPKTRPTPDKPDRTLLEFAPLIYVAWSDGLLTEEEIARIRARIARTPVSAPVQRVLDEWLNPEQPPTPGRLYGLLEMMRAARGRSRRKFASLAELGRFLARSGGKAGRDVADTPELIALREVEAALGVAGEAVMRAVIRPVAELEAALPRVLDPDRLAQFVDADRYDVRRYVFNLLQRPVFDRSGISGIGEHRERVLVWCRELARVGVSSYGYPREYEGEGNIPKSIAAFETLAYHDLSLLVKFGVQFGLFGGSILQLGTRTHHDKYLRAAATLELPGCFAMTETGHGSNVRDIETVASYDIGTREFVIDTPGRSAWKDYIGNAARHARMAIVFAQLEVNGNACGVHAFLVSIRDEAGNLLAGVQIEDCGRKIGLNGVDNGRLAFAGVRVPRENLLDRFGSVGEDGSYSSPIENPSRRFFTMIGTLVAGRTSIAAASVSATKLGLNIAARYAQRRRQFGPENGPEVPLLTYRSVQRRLLPLVARTYALDFAVHDTVRKFAQPHQGDREIELRAAALKAAASRHAADALQYSRELCGGQGYMWENRIGELRADTDVFTTFEGANHVLLQLVARGLLTELREQFEEMRIWAAVRHVTARASSAMAELNPVITRKTDEEHLRDPEFHAASLRYREERLLRSAAARLRRLIAEGRDAFDAANECQEHLMKLGEAYTDRIAYESFQARIGKCGDLTLKAAMIRLCALFALATIEADRGWFLESGYLEAVKSKAIRTQVIKLADELHEHAVALTGGWGIPIRYLPDLAH